MVEAVVRIKDDSVDPEQLDDLAVDLRHELLEGPIEEVSRRSSGTAPSAARGTDLVEVGVLVVQFAANAGLLSEAVRRLADWRSRKRVLQVEIELGDARLVLSDATPEQQQALIDAFIRSSSVSAS
jgi:hypothetical protein